MRISAEVVSSPSSLETKEIKITVLMDGEQDSCWITSCWITKEMLEQVMEKNDET